MRGGIRDAADNGRGNVVYVKGGKGPIFVEVLKVH